MKPTSFVMPNPSRRRVLFVIDIEKDFETKQNTWIIPNVERLILQGNYNLFIEATFCTDGNPIWNKQDQWSFHLEQTYQGIKKMLDPAKTRSIIKSTKSVFLADPKLVEFLKSHDIQEIHCVGYDINDCVMATANDGFDSGFFSYVIEECSESSESEKLRDDALAILRENEMTNHSELIAEKQEIK